MRHTQLPPIFRDVTFLAAGTGVFVMEALRDARPVPMTLGMLLALGPSFVATIWRPSRKVDTGGSGLSLSSGSGSQSPTRPSPSDAGGEL